MKFSNKTIDFLKKAGRQKKETWLEKNREEYEQVLLAPMQHLAATLKKELSPIAQDYNFPQKGISRMKRSAMSVAERGGGIFKNWVNYSASRPRTSLFEHNPNIFFLINSEDEKDPILLAGGLYMPSSRQMRALREVISIDASAFERLFATKEFKASFPDGFSDERKSTRVPRGYDANHPKIEWIKLQGFFVWKPYSRREFGSADFAKRVATDARQILRLNKIMEQVLSGRTITEKKEAIAERLEKIEKTSATLHTFDF